MHGKPLPSPAAKWPEIVVQAFGLLDDLNWINASTIINGLPGETEEDVLATIELVEDLDRTSSLIVPMNFVSMHGPVIGNAETFTIAKMRPVHWQLIGTCLEHNLDVLPKLLRTYRTRNDFIGSLLLSYAARWMAGALRHYVSQMKRGEPPTTRREASKWLYPSIPD
jgi:hypothetical protein